MSPLMGVLSKSSGTPFLVQRGVESFTDLQFVATVTLSTPVEVGKSFATIQVQPTVGSTTYMARFLGTAVLQTVVNGKYTELKIERYDSGSICNYYWQVVTGEMTVQMIADSYTGFSTTRSINAVNTSETFVLCCAGGDNRNWQTSVTMVELSSATQITLSRESDTTTCWFSAYIITIEGSTVQQIAVTNENATPFNQSISSVDLSRSFVVQTRLSDSGNRSKGSLSQIAVMDRLTSSTNVQVDRDSSDGGLFKVNANLFVVQLPADWSVQTDYSTGNSYGTKSISVSSVDTSKAFVVGHQAGNFMLSSGSGDEDMQRLVGASYVHSATEVRHALATVGNLGRLYDLNVQLIEAP